jgi:hypothetical protein
MKNQGKYNVEITISQYFHSLFLRYFIHTNEQTQKNLHITIFMPSII